MKFPNDIFIVDAVRTPIGRHRGALSFVRPDDLAAHTLRALLNRAKLEESEIHEVVFGAANQSGEDNRNVARMAALLAGMPYSVRGVTVNRLCGSGLEAIHRAAMSIAIGDAECVIAGGVESMTRAPFVMAKANDAFERTPPAMFDTSLGWRFPNERMAQRFELQSMGETAENVAVRHSIHRDDQDRFAFESHQRSIAAWANGWFNNEVVPVSTTLAVGGTTRMSENFVQDEGPRKNTTVEQLAKLQPAFRTNGTVTAGNSSSLNDGAAALLLMSESCVKRLQKKPLARIVSFACAGIEPNYMGEGPIPATRLALERAGWQASDLDAIEINEAFAAQTLACMRSLELDPAKVNRHGGAIALGHPLGASGARIVTTLVHAMRQHSLKRGLATLCIGVGQGMATLFEAV